MEKFLEKLSNYHILANLMPGIIYIVLSDRYFNTSIYNNNIAITLFLGYFIGIIVGRFSSLVVFLLVYVIKNRLFSDDSKANSYSDYIMASKNDEKLPILVQDNNLYRNICGALILLLLYRLSIFLMRLLNISGKAAIIILFLLIIILLVFSVLKQQYYIDQRINIYRNKTNK